MRGLFRHFCVTNRNDVEIGRGAIVASGARLDERVGWVLWFVYCRCLGDMKAWKLRSLLGVFTPAVDPLRAWHFRSSRVTVWAFPIDDACICGHLHGISILVSEPCVSYGSCYYSSRNAGDGLSNLCLDGRRRRVSARRVISVQVTSFIVCLYLLVSDHDCCGYDI